MQGNFSFIRGGCKFLLQMLIGRSTGRLELQSKAAATFTNMEPKVISMRRPSANMESNER